MCSPLFQGEGSPTRIDHRKKIGSPYSDLSTGGPSGYLVADLWLLDPFWLKLSGIFRIGPTKSEQLVAEGSAVKKRFDAQNWGLNC